MTAARARPRRRRRRIHWVAAMAAAGSVGLNTAHADAWQVDGTASARAESTDNFGLGRRAEPATTLAAGGELQWVRETEAERTRASLALEERRASGGRSGANDARLVLGHRLRTRTGLIDGTVEVGRGGPSASPRTPEEALIGPVVRTARGANLSWTQELSERWSTSARSGLELVSFSGRSATSDYRTGSAGITLERSLDERSTANATVSFSDFTLTSGQSGTRTVSATLGGSHAADERSRWSAAFGTYRADRRVEQGFQACPLPVVFCQQGLVPTVPVSFTQTRSDTGLQFDLSWRWQPEEISSLQVTAAQQLQPGVLGVQRSQTLRARLDRRIAPRWTSSLDVGDSRSQSPSGVGSPALQSLDLSLGWEASTAWTIGFSCALRQLNEPLSGTRARSATVGLTLRYQLPRLWSDR